MLFWQRHRFQSLFFEATATTKFSVFIQFIRTWQWKGTRGLGVPPALKFSEVYKRKIRKSLSFFNCVMPQIDCRNLNFYKGGTLSNRRVHKSPERIGSYTVTGCSAGTSQGTCWQVIFQGETCHVHKFWRQIERKPHMEGGPTEAPSPSWGLGPPQKWIIILLCTSTFSCKSARISKCSLCTIFLSPLWELSI